VERLTSRHHPLVAAFRAAARGGAGQPLLLDGWHLVVDAARAGVPLTHLAVAGELPGALERDAVSRLAARGAQVVEVSEAVLDAMSPVRTPSGVVALGPRPVVPFAALLVPPPALVLVAADVQDPGNAGAVVRAAEAGGATGVVLAGTSADPWGWKALRASMGSALRLPLCRHDDLAAACRQLRDAGLRLVATVPRGGQPFDGVALRGPVALLLGGEGPGLPAAVLDAADAVATIPMRAPVESLNVAVAAALLVYEAARQRGGAGGAA
jgi:TrmH family RNA methyltransferase